MSAEVADALAHAERPTEEKQSRLIRPAQADRNRTPRSAPLPQLLQPTAQHLRGTLGVPAFFVSRRLDILGWNRLTTIVFGDCARLPRGERNVAR
ncbi:MmyB family transcriptional regulator [Streptomyces acidiscabies]|jgi:hypothetical protein|uniref:MmyB family transcriptional regulator n=1 Tax=Streptomyces acidiscabies TaxID=42234 RepID=UPI000952A01C|nr:hypothetical protein [Streptomyces acidiscabies]GAV37827.1 hypothetical protein Saa2_00701 [Streptomyces acidiscabies]